MKRVSEALGIKESFLAQAVQGRIPERTDAQQEAHRVHRRFFTALALHDLVHEVPIRRVALQYGATKGLLQTLQSAAGTFAGMVTAFCNRLGWSNLELLLSQFQSRLLFGVERELCDLVRISLLNGFRARVLYNAGYHTLAALATANPALVETALRNALPFKSYKLAKEEDGVSHASAREMLRSTWCEKLRRGMTEFEAAASIVAEARAILSSDFNVPVSAWESNSSKQVQYLETSSRPTTSKTVASLPLLPGRRKSPTAGKLTEEQPYKKPCKDVGQKLSLGALRAPMGPPHPSVLGADTQLVSSVTLPRMPAEENEAPHSTGTSQDKLPLELSPICLLNCVNDSPVTDVISATPSDTISKELSFGEQLIDGTVHSGVALGTENIPCTIPDSFTCPADDASMSFSFQTLAMIDAAVSEAAKSCAVSPAATSRAGAATYPHRTAAVEEEEEENGDESKMSLSSCISQALNKYLPDENGDNDDKVTSSSGLNHCTQLLTPGSLNSTSYRLQGSLKELSSLCSSQLSQSGVTLIDVTSNQALFDVFLSECREQKTVAFSMAYSSIDQVDGIGSIVVKPKCNSGIKIPPPFQNEQVLGVAFNWGDMDVYFVSLRRSDPEAEPHGCCIPWADRVQAIRTLFEHREETGGSGWEEVVAYDAKRNVKRLALSCGAMPATDLLSDPLVADWMLNPDAKEKTLHKMVLHYLPEQPLFLSAGSTASEDLEEVPLSSLATNSSDPEMQASAECILAYTLSAALKTLLEAEGLYDAYRTLEMPSLSVLAKIELNGIGFSPEECANQRDTLQKRVSELECEAYGLAGHTFSLSSPEDVASVLFLELKLPSGSDVAASGRLRTLGTTGRRRAAGVAAAAGGGGGKRAQHLSTAKDVLEKIRPLHPLPGLVLEWRRVSATMSKMVYPLLKDAIPHEQLDCFRIHASVQIHTATGRVTMADPSLQMVPKKFDIGSKKCCSSSESPVLLSDSQCLQLKEREGINDDDDDKAAKTAMPSSICMRSVFQPFPGGVYLTADY